MTEHCFGSAPVVFFWFVLIIIIIINVFPCRQAIYMRATSCSRPTEADEDLHSWPGYPSEHLWVIQSGTLIGGDNYALLPAGALTCSRWRVAFRLMSCYVHLCVCRFPSSCVSKSNLTGRLRDSHLSLESLLCIYIKKELQKLANFNQTLGLLFFPPWYYMIKNSIRARGVHKYPHTFLNVIIVRTCQPIRSLKEVTWAWLEMISSSSNCRAKSVD